ncbi:transcription elongation factor GreA [Caminibacter mediatlanticus TB-2]|uniref:Transcription elongation factor GreA n=1 Tax=Caminibacter mediatlanticus TB-2 TaxID=391592 RepID=A0AAI9AIH1_9BACT|nr:transcription elongation factor GreA [Caminibacter mediatlanticus]EDM24084.1 transcription elongation factor GreA [Caminibacter mediatlanticus TB-2]QCT94446.1 transcription elongation factor GreA [Caminibacter mediatlanticus TB-2]
MKEPMTKYGYEKLSKELEYLKTVARPEVAKEIDAARELGDLKENAEYHAAKEKQAHIERRIAELSDILSRAVVVDPKEHAHDRVSFGSTVYLVDLDSDEEFKYTIVGAPEADPDKGLISYNSPLAKALIGKHVGDEVEVNLPSGTKYYEIEKICFEDICFTE